MEFFSDKFQLFTLLFARLLALLSVMPALGGAGISFFYRVAIAFLVSLIVTPVVDFPPEIEAIIKNSYVTLVLEQVFIGVLIGVSLQFIFGAFQMAGEFFSVQIGFGISEVFDPLAQVSLPLIGTVKNLMALYVFFISSSHLLTIEAVVYSFHTQPFLGHDFLLDLSTHGGLLEFLTLISGAMFLVGLKIAIPIMGTLLLVSITLGILSKAAPQMNILMLGFPLKIMVAFVVLTWASPVIVESMTAHFDTFFQHLDGALAGWGKAGPLPQ